MDIARQTPAVIALQALGGVAATLGLAAMLIGEGRFFRADPWGAGPYPGGVLLVCGLGAVFKRRWGVVGLAISFGLWGAWLMIGTVLDLLNFSPHPWLLPNAVLAIAFLTPAVLARYGWSALE